MKRMLAEVFMDICHLPTMLHLQVIRRRLSGLRNATRRESALPKQRGERLGFVADTEWAAAG